jgi:hypothetical protein
VGDIEGDEVDTSCAKFDKGLKSIRVVRSKDANMMTVAEETCAPFWGLEFWDGVSAADCDGVPKVWGKGLEEGFVDEAAEE